MILNVQHPTQTRFLFSFMKVKIFMRWPASKICPFSSQYRKWHWDLWGDHYRKQWLSIYFRIFYFQRCVSHKSQRFYSARFTSGRGARHQPKLLLLSFLVYVPPVASSWEPQAAALSGATEVWTGAQPRAALASSPAVGHTGCLLSLPSASLRCLLCRCSLLGNTGRGGRRSATPWVPPSPSQTDFSWRRALSMRLIEPEGSVSGNLVLL